MMPDPAQILVFIDSVFTPVLTDLGAFTGAVFVVLFLFLLFQELLDNAQH